MMRQCEKCGTWFVAKVSYAKLCYPCWKRRQDAEATAEELARENEVLRRSNATLHRMLDETRRLTQPAPATVLPADLLLEMIYLCHPDRHGNSAVANRVTSFLLAERRRMKGTTRA